MTPGLYKARPRLVVVARRLRRHFAFARGPKGVRLHGEVMKTVRRVARVFARAEIAWSKLSKQSDKAAELFESNMTKRSCLRSTCFSPFHFCRLLLRHFWEKPWPHCLHRKPREPPGDCEEIKFQCKRGELCFSLSSAGCAWWRLADDWVKVAVSSAVPRTLDLRRSQLGFANAVQKGFCNWEERILGFQSQAPCLYKATCLVVPFKESCKSATKFSRFAALVSKFFELTGQRKCGSKRLSINTKNIQKPLKKVSFRDGNTLLHAFLLQDGLIFTLDTTPEVVVQTWNLPHQDWQAVKCSAGRRKDFMVLVVAHAWAL